MLLYAGYKECTVRLFAGMPVCYIYRQQEGRQWSRPMAGRTNMKDKKLEEAIDYVCSCCPYIFTALNGTSRIRHLRTGATLLPSIATGAWFAR